MTDYKKIFSDIHNPNHSIVATTEGDIIDDDAIICEWCECDMTEDDSWNGDNDPVCLDCNLSAADDLLDRIRDRDIP